MNTSSTFTTAILRGVYVAVVVGLIAGLSAYKVDHQTTSDIITGLLAGLGALGIRGGVEGVVDANRKARSARATCRRTDAPPQFEKRGVLNLENARPGKLQQFSDFRERVAPWFVVKGKTQAQDMALAIVQHRERLLRD
jgi:hypothetical protein